MHSCLPQINVLIFIRQLSVDQLNSKPTKYEVRWNLNYVILTIRTNYDLNIFVYCWNTDYNCKINIVIDNKKTPAELCIQFTCGLSVKNAQSMIIIIMIVSGHVIYQSGESCGQLYFRAITLDVRLSLFV